MAKVTRSSGRGTKRRTTDTSKKSSFSGKSYREYQEARKKVTGDRYISTGRGTGRRKVSAKKSTARPAYKGTRSTGRGTAKRKSRG